MIVLIDKFLKRTDNFGFGFGGMAEWLKATDCKSVLSEYVGSNPTPSTTVYAVFGVFREVCGCSSVGRALVFQTKCREFEPRRPLQILIYWISPCGSVVEHSLGKGEVAGPIPAMGTRFFG